MELFIRRQKRWWNAYLLFYERVDILAQRDRGDASISRVKMPSAIERSVCKENINFLHTRTQFSEEYFQFIKKLTLCNGNTGNQLQVHNNKVHTYPFYVNGLLRSYNVG